MQLSVSSRQVPPGILTRREATGAGGCGEKVEKPVCVCCGLLGVIFYLIFSVPGDSS
jgi:hypothetical protein